MVGGWPAGSKLGEALANITSYQFYDSDLLQFGPEWRPRLHQPITDSCGSTRWPRLSRLSLSLPTRCATSAFLQSLRPTAFCKSLWAANNGRSATTTSATVPAPSITAVSPSPGPLRTAISSNACAREQRPKGSSGTAYVSQLRIPNAFEFHGCATKTTKVSVLRHVRGTEAN